MEIKISSQEKFVSFASINQKKWNKTAGWVKCENMKFMQRRQNNSQKSTIG